MLQKFPRQVVGAPALAVSRARLDNVLSSLVQWQVLLLIAGGVGTRWSQGPFLSLNILQVHDSMMIVTHFEEHILPLVLQAVAFPQAPVSPAIAAPFIVHSGNNFQSRASSPTKLTQQVSWWKKGADGYRSGNVFLLFWRDLKQQQKWPRLTPRKADGDEWSPSLH